MTDDDLVDIVSRDYWGAPPTFGILTSMTRALDAAIAKLATLPPEEQDRIGNWLL